MPRKRTNISGVSNNLSKSITTDLTAGNDEIGLQLLDKRIGISVSESEEFGELGFSRIHQKDITIEITRYLLANGAHLVYGGDLRQDGYTLAFSELAFQYRVQSENSKMHFTNYFGWPIHLALKHSDEATFKKNRVKVQKVLAPDEVPESLRNEMLLPNSDVNNYYWAKSMSKMRQELISNCDGRVIVGGKLTEYKGFLPGIIEETYLALQAKQPTYILGMFGGAASFVIRAIKGESVEQLEEELNEWFPKVSDVRQTCVSKGDNFISVKETLKVFRKTGIKGLSKINKLTPAENDILFGTKNFHEIIFYILKGINKALK